MKHTKNSLAAYFAVQILFTNVTYVHLSHLPNTHLATTVSLHNRFFFVISIPMLPLLIFMAEIGTKEYIRCLRSYLQTVCVRSPRSCQYLKRYTIDFKLASIQHCRRYTINFLKQHVYSIIYVQPQRIYTVVSGN